MQEPLPETAQQPDGIAQRRILLHDPDIVELELSVEHAPVGSGGEQQRDSEQEREGGSPVGHVAPHLRSRVATV